MAFAVCFFCTLVVNLRWLDVLLPRYGQKCFFANFKTGFLAFAVHFWALWWLFCVDRTYLCEYTYENVSLQTLKQVLWHSPFIFEYFGGYFASIKCTFTKIEVKMFFCRHWNRFYSICRSFLSTWMVVLRWSNVPLPKYWEKYFYIEFVTLFTAFAVHFWALWWLFCFDWPYRYQSTGENVSLPTLKPVWLRSPFYFWALWLLFYVYRTYRCQNMEKTLLRWPWNRF